MIVLLYLMICACLYERTSSFLLPKSDPEVYMNITQTIRYYGYPCEDYDVITEDGYILSIQRIPHGRENQQINGSRPVVLLQHGLLDSAHTWVINMPHQSLGFILADKGFDVWLANSRGSTYSRKHIYLDTNSKDFWDFTFDDMAKYDLPECINTALIISNAATLSLVGHSQGALLGLIQLSRDHSTASLVSSFVALGPVATVANIGWVPNLSLKAVATAAPVINFFSGGEFLANTKLLQFVASSVCTNGILKSICYDPIFWIAGFDISNLNKSRVPVMVGHTPAGTSTKNLVHFNQLVKSGKFQMYDYGSASDNQYKYGRKTPPFYDVSKLNVPVAMYWGGKDVFATPEDVKNLIPFVYKSLKYHKYIDYYNHMDFVWGIDAHEVIYKEVVPFMVSNIKL